MTKEARKFLMDLFIVNLTNAVFLVIMINNSIHRLEKLSITFKSGRLTIVL